jgi:hypothetical protein
MTAVGEQQTDALRGIDGGSAADRDKQPLTAVPHQVGAGQAVHVPRVRLDPVEYGHLYPSPGQRRPDRRDETGGPDAGIGDEEHGPAA